MPQTLTPPATKARYNLGDEVAIRFFPSQASVACGEIVGVHFTQTKVTYDIDLTLGGETVCNVDSSFVESVPKKK